MTDKPIIVDNIDVSKCEYRDWRNFCHCDNSKENEGEERVTGRGGCKYNPNCYFKQLKRKEEECEKLYIQLKTDEEYHKEEENTLRKIIKNKEERNIELYKENKKFKQAIDEIEYLVTELFLGVENKDRTYCEKILNLINNVKERK